MPEGRFARPSSGGDPAFPLTRAATAARRFRSRLERRYLDTPATRIALRGRLLHPYWRYRFHSFGAGSILHKPMWLHGAHKIAIGDGSAIVMGLLSAENPAWSRPDPAISIGNRVWIRPFTTINAAESVVIEDDVGIGSHCLVTDLEHVPMASYGADDAAISAHLGQPARNPIALGPVETAPVRIGRGTAITERVAVLSGSNIGKYCVIGTNSVVRGRIPDYSVAVGAPARVVGTTRPEADDRDPAGAA